MSDDRIDPTQDPRTTNTQPIESTGTNMTEQPSANHGETPLRVEPPTPVPDDVVTPEETDTRTLPQLDAPPPPATTTQSAWQPPAGQPLVTVRRGPLPVTIMLGLLSLIVSAYVLVTNLTRTDLDLRLIGPMMFGAVGGLLLIVGLIGVFAGGRSRGSD